MIDANMVRDSVERAVPGTDIYGVVEKIAYRLYLNDSSKDADANWFQAQKYFINWAIERPLGPRTTVELDLKEVLQSSAHQYSQSRNSAGTFDYWIMAQNDLAFKIVTIEGLHSND